MKETLGRITEDVNALLRDAWPLVSPEVIGLEGWLSTAGTWSEQLDFCADCDVSCMVSPGQFEEIFLPPLREAILQSVPFLRRIWGAGRAIQVLARPEEIGPLLDEIPPEGILLSTSCRTEAEGRALAESRDGRFCARA